MYTDHALITFQIAGSKQRPDENLRRDWRGYTKERLTQLLGTMNWNFDSDSVQAYWVKVSFWGLFKTNFYDRFRKLFLFTKFIFLSFVLITSGGNSGVLPLAGDCFNECMLYILTNICFCPPLIH